MAKNTRFVGMDVHAETIAVAVAEGRERVARSLGTIANRPEAVRRLLGKLGDPAKLKVCDQPSMKSTSAPVPFFTRSQKDEQR
jgi:transposase